jgi:translation initiation factor 4A
LPIYPSVFINYDMPKNVENYIIRVGRRSVRYGSRRVGLTLLTEDDMNLKRETEKYFDTVIEECPVNIADLI